MYFSIIGNAEVKSKYCHCDNINTYSWLSFVKFFTIKIGGDCDQVHRINLYYLNKKFKSSKMVVTSDIHIPSDEELTVPEVNLSGAALRAGAFHLGKFCEKENNVIQFLNR